MLLFGNIVYVLNWVEHVTKLSYEAFAILYDLVYFARTVNSRFSDTPLYVTDRS